MRTTGATEPLRPLLHFFYDDINNSLVIRVIIYYEDGSAHMGNVVYRICFLFLDSLVV